MAELASNHNDLAAMVALVRDEIGEHMPNVERQVAPYIGLRRRDLSACRNPKLEKLLDTATTPLQRYQQTPTRDLAPVDSSGNGDPVLLAERLEPHAPRVVHVPRNHADSAPWFSRNRSIPDYGWKLFDEMGRNEAVRPPRGEDGGPQI